MESSDFSFFSFMFTSWKKKRIFEREVAWNLKRKVTKRALFSSKFVRQEAPQTGLKRQEKAWKLQKRKRNGRERGSTWRQSGILKGEGSCFLWSLHSLGLPVNPFKSPWETMFWHQSAKALNWTTLHVSMSLSQGLFGTKLWQPWDSIYKGASPLSRVCGMMVQNSRRERSPALFSSLSPSLPLPVPLPLSPSCTDLQWHTNPSSTEREREKERVSPFLGPLRVEMPKMNLFDKERNFPY